MRVGRGFSPPASASLLPRLAIVLLCAWAYQKYGGLPQAQAVLYGVKPVIIAIVVCAIWGLCRAAVKNWYYVLLGAGALTLALLGVDVLVLLFAAGALAATADWVSLPKGERISTRPALDVRDCRRDDRVARRTDTSQQDREGQGPTARWHYSPFS